MKHEPIMSPATQQSHPECCPPAVDPPPGCLYRRAHWDTRGRRRGWQWSCRWSLPRERQAAGGTGGAPGPGFDLGFRAADVGGVVVVDVGVAVAVDVGGVVGGDGGVGGETE